EPLPISRGGAAKDILWEARPKFGSTAGPIEAVTTGSFLQDLGSNDGDEWLDDRCVAEAT
ncbi:MAG: hypothetical protein U0892_12900, partial [Pirellulales bacterium]